MLAYTKLWQTLHRMGYSLFFFLDVFFIDLKQAWENKGKSNRIISSNGTIKVFIKFCP